ncbi:MAG: ABC transporter ATP-binding protein, partial [Oscillospiraceae bacterium]|nr:ABC transporter ATP-binding protein [Oscillospiraceae bacterium]
MLEIKNISIAYNDRAVVEDVSFSVLPGETVSIVGESGSGKSTILRAVQGLLGREGRIVGGTVEFDSVSLPGLSNDEMRKYRGAVIATVPQQAGLSMDPITKIGKQFHEAILTKRKITRRESDKLAADCMRSLSIKEPERILDSYPVMLSGGTNQRVALAMAMV